MSLLDFFTKQSPTEWLTKQLTPKSSGMRFNVGEGLNQQQTQQAQQTVRKPVTPVAPNPFDNIKNWVIKSITPPVEDFAKIGKVIQEPVEGYLNERVSATKQNLGKIQNAITSLPQKAMSLPQTKNPIDALFKTGEMVKKELSKPVAMPDKEELFNTGMGFLGGGMRDVAKEGLDDVGRTILKNISKNKVTKPLNVLDDMAIKSNPLIQEAKKYKTAEEFVKAKYNSRDLDYPKMDLALDKIRANPQNKVEYVEGFPGSTIQNFNGVIIDSSGRRRLFSSMKKLNEIADDVGVSNNTLWNLEKGATKAPFIGIKNYELPKTDIEKLQTIGIDNLPKEIGEIKITNEAGFQQALDDVINGRLSKTTEPIEIKNGELIQGYHRFVEKLKTGGKIKANEFSTKSQLTDIWKKANVKTPIYDRGDVTYQSSGNRGVTNNSLSKGDESISNIDQSVGKGKISSSRPAQRRETMQTKQAISINSQPPSGGISQSTNQTVKKLPTSKPEILNILKKPSQATSDLSSYKINVNHFNIAETKKQIVEKETENIRPILESKVGKVLSNKEVKDIADNTAIIMERGAGREQTKNWEAAMFNLRQRIASAAESGTIDKVFIDDLVNLKSQGSDIARKLQSLSMNANAKDMTSKRVILEAVLKVTDKTDEILEAAKGVDFNDYNQAVEFYRKFIKPTKEEWIDLVRYNSMLSSPNTHIVNTFSNAVNSAIIAPMEKSIAGGIDFLGSKVFRYPQKNFSGEGLEYTKNYYKGIGDASKRFLGVLKGERSMTNLDLRFIPPSTKGVSGKVATVLSYPTRLLEASDQFFTALTESGEKAAMSYKMSKGVKVAHPEITIKDKAAYRLFRQDLFSENQGVVLDAIDRVTNIVMTARNSPNWVVRNISKYSLPFVKTPMNIFKQGVEYSPLGVTTLAGNADKSEQLAKVIMGSSIGTALAIYATSDRLTFDSPISAKEKTLWAQSGKQSYSIKIGDKWVSYQKMPPMFSFPIAIFAGVKKLVDNKKTDDDTASILLGSLANAMQYYGDQSYFKSIGDLMGAAKGDQYSIQKVVSNIPQQWVPFRALGGWLARLTDDTQRTIDNKAGIIDKQMQLLFMNIPGMSQRLPAKLDEQENPIPNNNRLLNALSPVRVSQENKQLADFLNNYESLKQDTKTVQDTRDKETEGVRPVYDKIQSLVDQGRMDEARAEVNKLSDEDYAIYKKIKSTDKASETRSGEVKFYPTFKQIGKLVDDGNETEARKMLDNLSDEDYELYKKLKKRLTQ